TQRLLHPDLTGSLGYAHQHDVHEPHAANPKSQSSNKGKHHLQRHRNDAELRKLLHHAENEESPLVIDTEIVLCCQRIANRLLDRSIVVAEKIQPDHVDVVRTAEVAHGGKGDVDDAVDAVLAAFLWSGLEHPDYFIRNAADTNLLAQGETAGKQLLPGFRAQHTDTRPQ